jgi:inner membrane protein
MDNLTHSLVGAILGQMGLKRKTGLAMPTLIIAANIPDIDAVAVLLGGHQHLAIRRGITHGPIAMVVLPLLLWAGMLWYDRWQEQRGTWSDKRLPVHKGWLLALAYIGCLTHPALDWCNSYGIRLLEPFSHRWFYGDVLFIVDVWIWAALIAGVWLSLRRERRGDGSWTRPAWISFTVVCAYIFANGLITERAERMTAVQIEKQHGVKPNEVLGNTVPVQFWKRDMQWRDELVRGYGWFTLPNDVFVGDKTIPHRMDDPHVAKAVRDHPDGRSFLFWSRMPVAEIIGEGDKRRLEITDQRFGNSPAREQFRMSIPWKGRSSDELSETRMFREDHDHMKRLFEESLDKDPVN